jgi:CheY-like chemotaxis protein
MLNFDARRKLPSLLLIDDDMISREVTATMLTMSGYQIYTAEGGQAAVELLETGRCMPDVILMDAQMPGLSGKELVAALRQRVEANIYLISASQPPAGLAEATEGFLQKPFDAVGLTDLLRERKQRQRAMLRLLDEPGEPVVNEETLAQLRVMMPAEGVREIFVAVIADLHRRMQMLEGAIGRGNSEEIRRIGHAIKGGCGMAGAVQAARIGALLEDTAFLEAGDKLDNSLALLRDLRAATERLERMLDKEFTAP